jgi:hypothetical protein
VGEEDGDGCAGGDVRYSDKSSKQRGSVSGAPIRSSERKASVKGGPVC